MVAPKTSEGDTPRARTHEREKRGNEKFFFFCEREKLTNECADYRLARRGSSVMRFQKEKWENRE